MMRALQLGGLGGVVILILLPPILVYITSRSAYMKHLFCWQLIQIFLYLTSNQDWRQTILWLECSSSVLELLLSLLPTVWKLVVLVEFENSAIVHAHSTAFPVQGFIQALLLTSVFHERCVLGRWPLKLGVYMRRCKPPLWSPGAMSLKDLAISLISSFQIALPCIVRWPNLFLF